MNYNLKPNQKRRAAQWAALSLTFNILFNSERYLYHTLFTPKITFEL